MEEVVIVGGGPAGLVSALSLLEEGISPLVLERDPRPGHKACGELLLERLHEFEVRELVRGAVERLYESLTLRFHGRELRFSGIEAPGWHSRFRFLFINRKKWERLLAERVRRGGGEIRTEEVNRIEREEKHLLLNGELRARMVIGADGALSTVRRFLGGEVRYFGFAVGKRIGKKRVERMEEPTLIVDPSLTLRGYAWIFPGREEVNAGAGEFQGGAEEGWRAWERFSDRLGVGKEGARGAFIPLSFSTRTWGRRVLLVGDAGGFTHPLTGAGLNAALLTGWLGGKSCAEALRKGKERPEGYERAWKARLYLLHLRSSLLYHFFYRFFIRWEALPSLARFFLRKPPEGPPMRTRLGDMY